MATRKKAKSDLKIAQGKRRDAFFARLKQIAANRKGARGAAAGASAGSAPQ